MELAIYIFGGIALASLAGIIIILKRGTSSEDEGRDKVYLYAEHFFQWGKVQAKVSLLRGGRFSLAALHGVLQTFERGFGRMSPVARDAYKRLSHFVEGKVMHEKKNYASSFYLKSIALRKNEFKEKGRGLVD